MIGKLPVERSYRFWYYDKESDGGLASERSCSMDAIIALVISALGCVCCGIDFGMLYTFVSTALALYKNWMNYFNDKAIKR